MSQPRRKHKSIRRREKPRNIVVQSVLKDIPDYRQLAKAIIKFAKDEIEKDGRRK